MRHAAENPDSRFAGDGSALAATRRILVLSLLLLLAVPAGAANQAESPGDKTLSPYFFVKSDDPTIDRLPLKATRVAVRIAGVIADVTVSQEYHNEGKSPLEAIYIFPASTRAAVYGMKMTIGKRTIEARIKERAAARAEYEQAREAGQSASLLEQQRPNVFQMNVANIMPGDTIAVELRYTELLVPTDGTYEFVYPTVVGPRYSNTPADQAAETERWVENPYLHEGEAPTYTFDIGVELSTGLPLQKVACPSHQTSVKYDGRSFARVTLDPADKTGGNRDFVLDYRLAGGDIDSGLLLYPGDKENFFLLMVQPPARVTAERIPPREYIFIMDVSGSMHGFPIDVSKRLLRDLIGHLRPEDHFNVLLFAGASSLMAEHSLPATSENVTRALDVIDRQQGGGGTELLPALRRALALPRTEGVSRSIVVVTDGYVSVEREAFELIRHHLNTANLFTFGIGSSVNRYLIEGMARAGMGEPFVVLSATDAPAQAQRFRRYIQSPVLTGVHLDFNGFDAYDVEPATIPDVLAERPVIVFGKYRGQPAGQLVLSGTAGGGEYRKALDVGKVRPLATNSALRYLWARERLHWLADLNRLGASEETKKQITDLGLNYNLLTDYTSFVAVDTVIRRNGEKVETVRQPLPLPQGVSDQAVGGQQKLRAMPSTSYLPSRAGGAVTNAPAATEAYSEMEISRPADKRATHPDLLAAARKWTFPRAPMTSGVLLTLRFKQGVLRVDTVAASGGLTEAAIRQALTQQLDTIRKAFKADLQADPALTGTVVLNLAIDTNGRVSAVTLISSTF